MRQGNYLSSLFYIQAKIPQESDLFPDFLNIFKSNTPQTDNTTLATYTDNTVILSSYINPVEASPDLQRHLNQIENWSLK